MSTEHFDYLPTFAANEAILEKLKQVLFKAWNDEIKTELIKLRSENSMLKHYKEECIKAQQELQQYHERTLETARQAVKDLTFEEFFGEHLIEAWQVGRKVVKSPKCSLCDQDRKIHFTSPMGKELTEPCRCNKGTVVFEPRPVMLTRFKVKPNSRVGEQTADNNSFNKPVYYWYASKDDIFVKDTEFEIVDFSEIGTERAVDSTKPFEECSALYSVFSSRERCQEFCEYLAKKEADHIAN